MTHETRSLVAGLAFLLCWPSLTIAEDSLDRRMKAMSPDSVDCGRIEPGAGNRKEVLDCVRSLVEAGTAFRVRFDNSCTDSICAWGVFRVESSAAFQILSYDPKQCLPHTSDVWCGTFGELPCKRPVLTIQGDKVQVSCQGYEF